MNIVIDSRHKISAAERLKMIDEVITERTSGDGFTGLLYEVHFHGWPALIPAAIDIVYRIAVYGARSGVTGVIFCGSTVEVLEALPDGTMSADIAQAICAGTTLKIRSPARPAPEPFTMTVWPDGRVDMPPLDSDADRRRVAMQLQRIAANLCPDGRDPGE